MPMRFLGGPSRADVINIINATTPKFHIDTFACNAGGPQPIVGVGFTPKTVILLGLYSAVLTKAFHSTGFDNGTTHHCQYSDNTSDLMFYDDDESVHLYFGPANIVTGHIDSMDADGFTMNWTFFGVNLVYVTYLAIG